MPRIIKKPVPELHTLVVRLLSTTYRATFPDGYSYTVIHWKTPRPLVHVASWPQSGRVIPEQHVQAIRESLGVLNG